MFVIDVVEAAIISPYLAGVVAVRLQSLVVEDTPQ